MDDYYEWVKKEIDTERAKMGLGPIGNVLGYFPLIREGGMFVDVDRMAEAMGITPDKVRANLASDARTRERIAIYGGKIRLDAVDIFNSYRKQANNYLAKEGLVLTAVDALKGMSIDMDRQGLKQEKMMLRDLLEAERHYTGRFTPADVNEIAIKTFSSKYKLAIFGLKIPSAIKQTFSGFTASAMLPLVDSWRVPYYMTTLFDYAIRRGAKNWPNILEGHEKWDMMVKGNSQHTQSQYIATEIGLESAGGIFGAQVAGVPLKDVLVLPLRHMDMITRASAWSAAYDSKQRQLEGNSQLTDAQKHEQAFAFAEDITRQTQPAATQSDRTWLQKGNEYLRSMVPFTGQPFKNWNMLLTHMYLPSKRAWQAGMQKGGNWAAINETLQVMMGTKYAREQYNLQSGTGQKFMFAYVAPAMALALLARGRPPKDFEEFMGDLFAYNIAALPVIGPVISAKLLYDKFKSDGSPLYYEFLNNSAEVVKEIIKGDFEQLPKDASRLAAQTTGFPLQAVNFVIKASEGRFTENDRPALENYIGWALFGNGTLQAEEEETD